MLRGRGGGVAVAQSAELANPGEEAVGSIPAPSARSPNGWVGVSTM